MPEARITKEAIYIQTPYIKELISDIRNLSIREYNGVRNEWKMPLHIWNEVEPVIERHKIPLVKEEGLDVSRLSPTELYRVEPMEEFLAVYFPPKQIILKNMIHYYVPKCKYSRNGYFYKVDPLDIKELKEFLIEAIRIGFKFSLPLFIKGMLKRNTNDSYSVFKKRKEKINSFLENRRYCKLSLYNHQKEAVREALAHKRFGIFDELGVGKTFEGLDILWVLHDIKASDKSLIICPASAKFSVWLKGIIEFTDWYEKDLVCMSDSAGLRDSRYKEGTIVKNLKEIPENKKFLIVNYERLMNNREDLINWLGCKGSVLLDESHRVKNPEAKMTKALLGWAESKREKVMTAPVVTTYEGILDKVNYVYIMSGTPIANKPEDAWSQLRMLGVPYLGSFDSFKNYFSEYDREEQIRKNVNLEVLKNIVTRCSIRRLKEFCLDLPPKTYQTNEVELEKRQRKMYETLKEQLRLEILRAGEMSQLEITNAFVKLLRLAQMASNPLLLTENYNYRDSAKFKEIEELVDEIVENGHKVVLWTSFKLNVKCLEDMFQKYNPVYITGDVKPIDRADIVHKFQTDPKCSVFIGDSAARESITLTAASYAIYLDRDFNLVTWIQSQDRIHRNGQDKNCTIIKIIAKNTIDEKIDQKLESKHEVAKYLQGDFQNTEQIKLSKQDILDILS